MAQVEDSWFDDLARAVRRFDRDEAARLVALYVDDVRTRPDPVDPQTGVAVLRLLQGKRYITLVQDVAEALLAHGADTVRVRHRYALALLDNGRTAAAEALLATLSKQVRRTDTEVAGAIGRVHKQRYETSGPAAGSRRADDLAAAIAEYERVYRKDELRYYYHGINTAALLHRAAVDGVELPNHPDPAAAAAAIAEQILAGIMATDELTPWQSATAAEACVVLGRHHDAFAWLTQYLASTADAFELNSTLRQFQQLWRMDTDTEPGRRIIPMLRNHLLQAGGGEFSIAPHELTDDSLRRFDDVERELEARGVVHERVFGLDRFHPIAWLRDALLACRSVARVEDRYDGMGTGFVLAGDDLLPGRPGHWPARVLVTNHHVVPGAVALADVRITFRGLSDSGPDASVSVRPAGPILWESPERELDTCVLPLPDDLDPQVTALPIRKRFPALTARNEVHAYVIGHPLGNPDVRLSLHNSLVLDTDDRYAWYRSPTDEGSSGSPVLDDSWHVIALHHGTTRSVRGGSSAANEGIRIDRLLAAFAGG